MKSLLEKYSLLTNLCIDELATETEKKELGEMIESEENNEEFVSSSYDVKAFTRII